MNILNNTDLALNNGLVVNNDPYFSTSFIPNIVHGTCWDIFVDSVIARFEDNDFYPVGLQGKSNVDDKTQIGSYRTTVHDKEFAKYLNNLLLKELQPVILDEYSPMDWQSQNPDKLNYWIPLHISPVFRYMKYQKDGMHLAHYDSEYILPENPLIRTLYSGVLYLTDNKVYTRFIKDGQEDIPFTERNLNDWEVETEDNKVYDQIESICGNYVMFPHRLCHDVSKNHEGKERIIIRFDVFYQAVDKV